MCGIKYMRHIINQYVESFEMWRWRRMEISWADRVRNEVLQRGREERNIVHTVNRRNVNWIDHILHRNCLSKHVIEGKIKGGKDISDGKTRKKT